ncbi:Low-affinity glucose transporter [Talaromyces islandicus]|uniref:Low-affinity glucose transporter n=1 Tax=Talaromyces islandicus TaxID=28573 RepID=A0A0U1M6W3_TALIS|nr:Low-affinity glucose transporter [Talaromyces islandicus]
MGRLSRRKQVLGSIPIDPNDCSQGMFIDPLTIEYRANMTEAPKYSLDSQPSWLPSGSNMERTMDMTFDDWENLTEDDSNPPLLAPNFMRYLLRYHSTGDWGFVFYRTTYEQDDEGWSIIQKRLNAIIESVFDFYGSIEGVNEARRRWKLHWMDDPNEFRDMSPHSIATNYQHSMCFAVDRTSAHSVLRTDITGMQTRGRSSRCHEEDEDGENWRGPFRAHPSSIVDEIYTIIASQMMEMHQFAYAVRGTDDIWWSSYAGVWTVDGEGRNCQKPLYPGFVPIPVLKLLLDVEYNIQYPCREIERKMAKNSLYTFGIAIFAAIGTFLFGFDTGIATTTIAHQSWIDYMQNPSHGLTGAVVSVYIAGEAVGALTQTFIGDRLGRIRFMQLMCVFVTIGCVIQTASVNIGMFLAGRVLAGFAVGGMVATVPIYLSEISSPKHRGLIGGISGCGISFGTMMSNWVGFACGYAPNGALQWRLPLGIQIPWGVIMFIGLSTFMPNSPRQLIRHGKVEDARREFIKIRRDLHLHEMHTEFALMRAQIEYEMQREITSYKEIFKLFRHRALASIAVQTMTSLTGVNVIQYYQTTLYKSLGINSHTILALAAVYGTVAFLANSITTKYLTDQWGRRNMILTGLGGIILIEIYAAVMQREFQNTDNRVGKGFAILGIYLFVVCYYGMLNSTTWLYGAEILPISMRSKVMGLAAASHFIVNVAITEAGPSAFANIHENYYYVFVACTAFFLGVAYFYFPETKKKTLEEIAAAFGDKVVELEENDVAVEEAVMGAKAGSEHVE